MLTENERQLIPEILDEVIHLSVENQNKLFWFVKGMLFANGKDEIRE